MFKSRNQNTNTKNKEISLINILFYPWCKLGNNGVHVRKSNLAVVVPRPDGGELILVDQGHTKLDRTGSLMSVVERTYVRLAVHFACSFCFAVDK